LQFRFYTEDGEFKMDYADYCKSPDLMAKMSDDTRVVVNLGLRLLSFDAKWLDEHPKHKRFVEHMAHEREENPVRFFLPHCSNSPDFNTPWHAFINDDKHIYTAIQCGNRAGKTTIAFLKFMLRLGLIKTDPNWEVFKEHGVKYTPYLGPREVAIVTYMWDNHRETLWPKVIRQWMPKSVIADYAGWMVPSKTNGETLLLTDGLTITLKACSQPQVAFESGVFDAMLWDEQGVEAKFDGAEARLKTRRKWSKDSRGVERLTRGVHIGALTPHKVEGRPDTGSGTWLHRMAMGEELRGLTAKFYKGDIIRDAPDWIYPERQKKNDLDSLAEAEARMDRRRIRQIRSRLYGEWENSSGAVFDEYDEDIHVIDDFDIPPHWCAIRGWDHGRTNPTACVSCAITPNQDYVWFRDYMGVGMVISDCVSEVVKRCGNTLEQLPDLDLRSQVMRRWKEVPTREQYICDVLDGHSFKTPDSATRLTIGDLYRASGLTKIRPAPIGPEAPGIMLIKELLKVNPERAHLITGAKGAPRMYFMRGCRHIRRAMLTYINKPQINDAGNPMEKPQDRDNHIPDAMRYAIEARIGYMPECPFSPHNTEGGKGAPKTEANRGYWCPEDRKRTPARHSGLGRDRYTGHPL
jgi:hypothetical protein